MPSIHTILIMIFIASMGVLNETVKLFRSIRIANERAKRQAEAIQELETPVLVQCKKIANYCLRLILSYKPKGASDAHESERSGQVL